MLTDNHKLLITRLAVGGTGFVDHRWGPEDDLFQTMLQLIKTALALNPQNRLNAFLWHQGETDCIEGACSEAHYTNLSRLVRLTREVFDCPSLPFIAGDFVYQWRDENADLCKPIMKAIRSVCSDFGHTAFVETDGLLSNAQRNGGEDTIHFCREALYKLGSRYFEAYCKISTGIFSE